MKNKLLVAAILACGAMMSSCGTMSYWTSSNFDDAIYYSPTKESRAKMVADNLEQQEIEAASYIESDTSTYLAKDDDGNLYLIDEYEDGDSYEARLHKFDSPVYSFYVDYGPWYNPWYNPWWGSYRHPYYGYAYSSWYWGMYDPWYWGYGYCDPWFYGYYSWYSPYFYDRWYMPYGHGPGFGPGVPGGGDSPRKEVVYTHRSESNGSRMYKRMTEGGYAAGTHNSRTSSATYGSGSRQTGGSAVSGNTHRTSQTSAGNTGSRVYNSTSRSSRSSSGQNTGSSRVSNNAAQTSRSANYNSGYTGGGRSGVSSGSTGGGGGFSGGSSSGGGGGHRR